MAVKKKKRSAAKKKPRVSASRKARSARKKTAARTRGASRKRTAAGRRPRTHRFTYKCVQNTCTAVPPSKHMKPNDIASLTATGTNATLTFATSPFKSGVTTISLTNGAPPHKETVGSTPGTFSYTVACSACPSAVVLPPEMIVP
jgi:hypothetical protein